MLYVTSQHTTSCPLCGKVVWSIRGLLSTHSGKEMNAEGSRVLNCAASLATRDEAAAMAEREEAELDDLRLRAHP